MEAIAEAIVGESSNKKATPSSLSPFSSSPEEHRAMAIKAVERNEGLDVWRFVKVVQLFQNNITSADSYLAITAKEAHSFFLNEILAVFEK